MCFSAMNYFMAKNGLPVGSVLVYTLLILLACHVSLRCGDLSQSHFPEPAQIKESNQIMVLSSHLLTLLSCMEAASKCPLSSARIDSLHWTASRSHEDRGVQVLSCLSGPLGLTAVWTGGLITRGNSKTYVVH